VSKARKKKKRRMRKKREKRDPSALMAKKKRGRFGEWRHQKGREFLYLGREVQDLLRIARAEIGNPRSNRV